MKKLSIAVCLTFSLVTAASWALADQGSETIDLKAA